MSLFIWDTGEIIGYIKFIYLSFYIAEILFWLLLKHFFHDGLASNQGLPTPKAEKELNSRKIKKLNRLIAKMW